MTFVSTFIARRLSPGGSASVRMAIAGVSLSVAVMIMSIAVTGGFQRQIRAKLAGFEAAATISPLPGGEEPARGVLLDQALRGDILQAFGPQAQAATRASQAMILKTDDDFLGVVATAYGEGHDPAFELSNLTEGALPDSTGRQVALSVPQARKLRLGVGDRVDAFFVTPQGLRQRRLEVSGLYESHFGEYDQTLALVAPRLLEKILGLAPLEGTTIELRGVPLDQERATGEAARQLQMRLNRRYMSGELPQALVVQTLRQAQPVYFNWLDLLDTNVVVILVLMGCVSGFTLVACVLILILQRVRLIGLLKAQGITSGALRGVFLQLGLKVALWGLLWGNCAALGLLWLQHLTHAAPLDPSSYYLTYVPVHISPLAILSLDLGVLIAALGLMLLPVTLLGRISPATTIRFE